MDATADGIAIPQRIRESLDTPQRTLLGRAIRAITVRSHDEGVPFTGADGSDRVADVRELLRLVPRLGLSGEKKTPDPVDADQAALLDSIIERAAHSADEGGFMKPIVQEEGGRDGQPIREIGEQIGLATPEPVHSPVLEMQP